MKPGGERIAARPPNGHEPGAIDGPADLWSRGIELGRACRRAGLTAGSLDLLIAAVAIYHAAELVTFDADFQKLGRATGLRVQLLKRPAQ